MAEPMSATRLDRLAGLAELPCTCGTPDCERYSSALTADEARELVAEVVRLREEDAMVTAAREYVATLKRGVLQWGSYAVAGIVVWNVCLHLLGWPVWASWAGCVGAGVVIGWSQAEIENRLEARRDA
jgi:hypothetical protein